MVPFIVLVVERDQTCAVEENDMVRLTISSPAAACAQNCLAVPICILLVHVLKIEIPLALIIFICM